MAPDLLTTGGGDLHRGLLLLRYGKHLRRLPIRPKDQIARSEVTMAAPASGCRHWGVVGAQLPEPGRAGHDQAAELAIGHLLQQVDQHLSPVVEAVAGVSLGNEAAQALGFCLDWGGAGRQVEQAGITPRVELAQQQPAVVRSRSLHKCRSCGRTGHGRDSGGLIGARSRPPISAITRKAPTAAENCSASIARRAHSLIAKICSAW